MRQANTSWNRAFILGLAGSLCVAAASGCASQSRTRSASSANDADAQYSKGLAYDTGEGAPRDARAAADCYRKAAEQGHAGAQNNLGLMYFTGSGVKQDHAEAARWYRAGPALPLRASVS